MADRGASAWRAIRLRDRAARCGIGHSGVGVDPGGISARGIWGKAVAEGVYEYNGPGFSPMGDKGRFVLPAKFRKTLKDSNAGEKYLYLDKHPFYPCLIGFGAPYKAELSSGIQADAANPRERASMRMQLYSFFDVPFDESGRFVLPRAYFKLGRIEDAIYFHGNGPYFTLWNPEVLMAMEGEEFLAAQIHCESQLEAARERKG